LICFFFVSLGLYNVPGAPSTPTMIYVTLSSQTEVSTENPDVVETGLEKDDEGHKLRGRGWQSTQ
jgi:hypothetical protein